MKIGELFLRKNVVYSFEVFPPKVSSGIEAIYGALDQMSFLSPDFISITYGAGGSMRDSHSFSIARTLKEQYGITPLAHVTCVGAGEAEMAALLQTFAEGGIENILALRGDLPAGGEPGGAFRHATDLIRFARDGFGLYVAAASYPEGHPESASPDDDIAVMRLKQEMGAGHFITQLFFNNGDFYRFRDRAREAGVTAPIAAGIMPVTGKKQIERIVTLSGASFPPELSKLIAQHEHDPDALRAAGIGYAVRQIEDLIERGTQGIHLYTMNNPAVAAAVTERVRPLIEARNQGGSK